MCMQYRYREPKKLPPAQKSASLYLILAPKDMAVFRFLLEAYDNVAMFTVLDPKATLLKLIFSPHDKDCVLQILESMRSKIVFSLQDQI